MAYDAFTLTAELAIVQSELQTYVLYDNMKERFKVFVNIEQTMLQSHSKSNMLLLFIFWLLDARYEMIAPETVECSDAVAEVLRYLSFSMFSTLSSVERNTPLTLLKDKELGKLADVTNVFEKEGVILWCSKNISQGCQDVGSVMSRKVNYSDGSC